MAGPWEKYAAAPAPEAAPWAKYQDAVKQPQDDPVMNLGKAVMAALKQSLSAASPFEKGPTMGAAESMATPGSAPAEFATGIAQGMTRQTMAPDASPERTLGAQIGRPAPVVLGALGAAAAAPVLAPAAVLAAPLIAPAVAAGLGAAAGNTAGQVAAKATGGEAPESLGAALGETAKTGLETAAMDLGFGVALASAKALAPTAFQVFSKIPSESIKRAIKNPDIVTVGPGAQVKVEVRAAKALRDAQRGMENLRAAKGQAVDRALTGLGAATKNAPVIDGSKIAATGRQVLADASVGNDAVAAAIKPDLNRINKIAKALEKNPMLTAKEAVDLRRALDNLVKRKHGGMPDVSSDVGQRTVREMAAALRQSIGEAADKAGYTALKSANQDFSQFVRSYDEVAAEIATKETTPAALIKQVRRVAAKFNAGPTESRGLESVADRIPGVSKQMNRLLDLVAAREMTKLPRSTPSSSFKDLLLFLSAPQAVGAGIKGAGAAAPAGRVARRAVIAAEASE